MTMSDLLHILFVLAVVAGACLLVAKVIIPRFRVGASGGSGSSDPRGDRPPERDGR